MDEILITHNSKITLEKYLLKKISHRNNEYETYREVFKYLGEKLLNWIDNNKDLDRFIDDETFYNQFNIFIFSEYVTPTSIYNYNFDNDLIYHYEHYSSTYNEEIIDIFLNYKEIVKSFCIFLFDNKNDNSYPLVEFIFSICDYKDPYNGNINEGDSNYELDDDLVYRK